eukprot:jgi/Botrbrau1/3592/Bobra.0078s0043.1
MSRHGQKGQMKCMGGFESEGMDFESACMFSCHDHHDGYVLNSCRHLNTSRRLVFNCCQRYYYGIHEWCLWT